MDLHNLDDYVSSVVDTTVRTGVAAQMEAFRAGFNQVGLQAKLKQTQSILPLKRVSLQSSIGCYVFSPCLMLLQVFQLCSLQIFSEDELESLLCGRRELWMVYHSFPI